MSDLPSGQDVSEATSGPTLDEAAVEVLELPDGTTPVDGLRAVMARLREPGRGCEWDVAQSFATIAPFTIEEAYEVADAIAREDLEDLRDELGDLLFQVVFHARMAEEAGAFDFDDVARAIVAKMIRRHPHVFGHAVFSSDDERRAAWESAKATERAARDVGRAPAVAGRPIAGDERSDAASSTASASASVAASALDGVARSLPALVRADKVQRRAARVGFDWAEIAPVRAKVEEELAEVAEAAAGDDADALEDELGDLLFAVVNLARHHEVDAESALRRATAKFESRFRRVEAYAAANATVLDALDADALEALWERAKRAR